MYLFTWLFGCKLWSVSFSIVSFKLFMCVLYDTWTIRDTIKNKTLPVLTVIFANWVKGYKVFDWQEIRTEKSRNLAIVGAPGCLSWLSVWLLILAQIMSSRFVGLSPAVGWQHWQHGACLGFLSFSFSTSLSRAKINK